MQQGVHNRRDAPQFSSITTVAYPHKHIQRAHAHSTATAAAAAQCDGTGRDLRVQAPTGTHQMQFKTLPLLHVQSNPAPGHANWLPQWRPPGEIQAGTHLPPITKCAAARCTNVRLQQLHCKLTPKPMTPSATFIHPSHKKPTKLLLALCLGLYKPIGEPTTQH